VTVIILAAWLSISPPPRSHIRLQKALIWPVVIYQKPTQTFQYHRASDSITNNPKITKISIPFKYLSIGYVKRISSTFQEIEKKTDIIFTVRKLNTTVLKADELGIRCVCPWFFICQITSNTTTCQKNVWMLHAWIASWDLSEQFSRVIAYIEDLHLRTFKNV